MHRVERIFPAKTWKFIFIGFYFTSEKILLSCMLVYSPIRGDYGAKARFPICRRGDTDTAGKN